MSHTHSQPPTRRSAWIVDVNMGYGHGRAAHALRDLSGGEVVTANEYPGIPAGDRRVWRESRKIYEAVSRLRPVPVLGPMLFDVLDRWQQIPPFYPKRDLSKPNFQVRELYRLIRNGWGKHLIDRLARDPVPLVTTFFATAFFADHHGYPGEIYCVTTDADISRSWASLTPATSRINYFASNGRVVERLRRYGVPAARIFLTGFPLPKELVGGPRAETLKDRLAARLCNLDPEGIFHARYRRTLRAELGPSRCAMPAAGHPLTVTYSVGGAGAQRQLGIQILTSLRHRIARKELRLNLLAGTRADVAASYVDAAKRLGLDALLGEWICVPAFETRAEYFERMPDILATTDILWTKPSELSFYTGLGIAVVMAPPIGSQEEFNRVWLQYVGGGVPQNDPACADEWLFDWIRSGGVARMAWNGYVEAPTHGTYRIEDIVLGRESELESLPLIV